MHYLYYLLTNIQWVSQSNQGNRCYCWSYKFSLKTEMAIKLWTMIAYAMGEMYVNNLKTKRLSLRDVGLNTIHGTL